MFKARLLVHVGFVGKPVDFDVFIHNPAGINVAGLFIGGVEVKNVVKRSDTEWVASFQSNPDLDIVRVTYSSAECLITVENLVGILDGQVLLEFI